MVLERGSKLVEMLVGYRCYQIPGMSRERVRLVKAS